MAGRKKYSQYLRNNMSLPEVLLWTRIQKNQIGHHFHRQFPVGNYVLDFYCRKLRVAIEIDGAVHDFRKPKDESRDIWLKSYGISTFRIPAKTVLKNPDFAAHLIREHLDSVRATLSGETDKASESDERDTSLD